MEMLLSAIVGAVLGLLITVLFEEQVFAGRRRVTKWLALTFYRPKRIALSPQTFVLGNFSTSWIMIDGDGQSTYIPETIACLVNDTPLSLPPEVIELRSRIESREAARKTDGLSYQWNGPYYALERYAIGRTIPDECMEVVLSFRPTDYFTFQATVMSLDVSLGDPHNSFTLRQKYLEHHASSQPLPFLANGFGINLIILTSDRKLLLSRREDIVGARPGELDVSVAEGVHPLLDRATTHHGPDLYRTAIRGAQEEVGVELVQSEITFLGFGVDMDYYQWQMLGVARISETAERVLNSRRRGTGGKWEAKRIEVIDSDPFNVLQYIKIHGMWSTGLATLYLALVHEYGRKQVNDVVERLFH